MACFGWQKELWRKESDQESSQSLCNLVGKKKCSLKITVQRTSASEENFNLKNYKHPIFTEIVEL